MNIEEIKHQGRLLESRDAWPEALEHYRTALRRLEESGRPDPSLYGRLGDIYVRVESRDSAARSYFRAVELYLQDANAGSAFAVCQKVLRQLPEREEVYLEMGRIRALQGYMEYARQHFLTYAEMMGSRGDREEALRSLEELVELVPDDADTRIFLAERLDAEGRRTDAVAHLEKGYRRAVAEGDRKKADRLGAKLQGLRPEWTPGEETASEASQVAAETVSAHSGAEEPRPHKEQGGLWSRLLRFELRRDKEPVEEAAVAATAEEQDDLQVEFESEEATLRSRIAREPDQIEHHESLVAYATRKNDRALLTYALLHLAMALEGAGDLRRARETLERVLELDSANAWALEVLDRLGGGRTVEAELPTAEAEETVDSPTPAPAEPAWAEPPTLTADLPPEIAEAPAAAVEAVEPDAIPMETAARSESGWKETPEPEYVDLAALILDESAEPTTRWNVEFEGPSDDWDADFARVLSQFKEKVAEHLERDDARSHYDLGAAYREMGLMDEAISMFQQALRARPGHLPSLEMLGRCFLDKGEPGVAIRTMNKSLDAPVQIEDDLLGIYYYLGRAHEEAGHAEEALDLYERVFSLDINFMDVTERLRALR